MFLVRLILITMLSLPAFAAEEKKGFDVFTPAQLRSMLGDYPALGTAESDNDFFILLKYQDTRTEEECAEARLEEEANLTTMFAGPKGPLTKEEAKKLSLRILPLYAEAGTNILIAKKVFKRPRPYLVNKELKPCVDLESSYAYPSGHTAMARALAHFLSARWPERRDAFFARADEVAENRILGGVHHPTDIVSGKKLGDAIAKKIMKSVQFQSLLNP